MAVRPVPQDAAASNAARPLSVAFIGNPNTGKSTVFNALSGLTSRIGNFPGVTVEKKVGRVKWEGRAIDLIDLPGTYSLAPRSLDEMVSVDVLLGRRDDVRRPDLVVCIADASNLERNLYLVSQVLDMGLPAILVLNMWDLAEQCGVRVDVAGLSQRLGIPVLTTEAHRRQGLDAVRHAIVTAAQNHSVNSRPRLFPEAFYGECERLTALLERDEDGQPVPLYLRERLLLDVGGYVEKQFARRAAELGPYLAEARQRLAEAGCKVPAIEARIRYQWARGLLDGVATHAERRADSSSDKLDRLLTHRIAGLAIFGLIMFLMFQALYTWAGPFMGWIEALQELLAGGVEAVLPPGALRSLVVDGVIAGVGGVLLFLPQILLLFLFIAVLEDCGYMARAAFLMDKLMTRVGLSGKSFVPLMSSFACAVPGVMATRVIENPRDRMVTILVAPLMSCSARLPVYVLLIGAFIPPVTYAGGWVSLHGLVLFAVSSLGVLVAVPVAWLLKSTLFRGETPPFVMELPSYKWPSLLVVAHRVYDRGRAFVTRAGTLIFATSVVVWAAGYFPGDHSELDRVQAQLESLEPGDERSSALVPLRNELSGRLIADSFLGRLGRTIEPVVRPLGWDWKLGVGVVASFPAREVVIATLGTIYSLGGDVSEQDESLMGAMQAATWPDGRKVYNVPVALSVMVFFALCAQCGATLMVIKRETNSWRWPVFTFCYMTALAYLGALLTYQVGSRWLL
ncbi:MAG: ferrous iron transport protein B [Pirellulaceae bacterium]|nr:ferrous iron transport protein B [Pirellulaceae bacterium]